MKKTFLAVLFALCANSFAIIPIPTPTATPRPTATPTPSPTATPSPSPTATPSPTPVCDPEHDGDDECIEHNMTFEQCQECFDRDGDKHPKDDPKKKDDHKKDYNKKKKEHDDKSKC
jgi:hypothetical protein